MFVHHVSFGKDNRTKLQEFIEKDLPNLPEIINHGVGHLGKVYLFYANKDVSESIKKRGLVVRVFDANSSGRR
jgi:hypothetical protein